MAITMKQLLEATEDVVASKNEVHPADDLYLPPVTTVPLPSRGKVYPPESPLYMCDSVDIRPVTAKEEDILSSTTLIKKGTVLTALMRACITNRLIDPDQMLVGDRNAVLTAIRVSAYGPAYNCTVVCSACAETTEHAFDLSKVKMKTLDEDPARGPGTNEFAFVLPDSKRTVYFRLFDANTVTKLEKDIEALRKKGEERGVTLRLMNQIVGVEGITDAKALQAFIFGMKARDSRALRSHIDQMSPDIDMKQEFTCPACDETKEVDIPVGTEFFWPSEV